MRIHVDGQHALSGVYEPGGNPNAAMALLAAALLTEQSVTVRNMPRTVGTLKLIELAGWLGAEIVWPDENTLQITASQLARRTLDNEQVSSSGVLLLIAPLLARRQHIRLEIDFPLNRIRTHLDALRDLGLDVVTMNSAVECRAAEWESKDIMLAEASVTATGIVLMLAVSLGQRDHDSQRRLRTAYSGTLSSAGGDGRTYRRHRLQHLARHQPA